MTQPCVHRWRIEEAEGPTSEGTCANCGEMRMFPNTEEAAHVLKGGSLGGNWRALTLKQKKHALAMAKR